MFAFNVHIIPVFVDEVRFVLVGTFTSDPLESHPPTYLHVPPLSTEQINGMHCFRWTPTDQLFYWSLDPSGLTKISEREWELYGIPNLKLFTSIGSSWVGVSYWAIWDYFQLEQVRDRYDIKQFAIRHGYPLLVEGDPHAPAKNCPTTDILDVAIPKSPKSRIRRAASWFGKNVLKREGLAESKAKGKGKARELNLQAGTSTLVGQASIVEISDSESD
ncbi:hypothetical protein L218DRAFT_386372 [Marasmius fiardii PR-910]|nr:hypothetical protein L218DRAFT_386372 [Marasmius fiardii PR-910]